MKIQQRYLQKEDEREGATIMDLAEKYRPKKTADMEFGDQYRTAVASALKIGSNSFLLVGPSGCGKTTLGRIIAERLSPSDLIEIDAATNGKVEDARELRNFASIGNIFGNNRVILVDEAHAATSQAWQALLKVVEEPAEGVYWIFATTEEAKVPKTIRTRCSTIHIKELDIDQIENLLGRIVEAEKFELADGILEVCAKQAFGSARQAIMNLGIDLEMRDGK